MEDKISIKNRILTEQDIDFTEYYVHGAKGGVTPYDFRLIFYKTEPPILDEETHLKILNKEIEPVIDIIQTDLCAITMSPLALFQLSQWLVKKVKEFEKNFGEIPGKHLEENMNNV